MTHPFDVRWKRYSKQKKHADKAKHGSKHHVPEMLSMSVQQAQGIHERMLV